MESRKRTGSISREHTKKSKLECSYCDKTFSQRRGLNRHILSEHNASAEEFKCDVCPSTFKRKDYLNRHKKRHAEPTLHCETCGKGFYRQDKFKEHKRVHEQRTINQQGGRTVTDSGNRVDHQSVNNSEEPPINNETKERECISTEEAISGNLKTYTLTPHGSTRYDPMLFLRDQYATIKTILTQELARGIKWYITLNIRFTKQQGDETVSVEPHFHGKCHIALKIEDLAESLRESFQNVYNAFIEYQREGSNWTLDEVTKLIIHTARYKPLKASSYIPLPIKLRTKRAIINIKNRDERCFKWAVLSALHPTNRDNERISKYTKFKDELNFGNIQFPVKTADIPKFEKLNKISVNLFGYEKESIYPLHLTKSRYERHVNLLVLSKGTKSHYCWIKNFNRLLHDQNKDRNQYHYCKYCLHGFTKRKLLKNHESYCQIHGAQRTEMPSAEDKWLYYKDVSKQLKAGYVVYADFECINTKFHTCSVDPEKSSTTKTTQHIPSGFTYKIVGPTEEMSEDHVTYRGLDVPTVFINHMLDIEERLVTKLKEAKPLQMTPENWQKYNEANDCHICKKPLGEDRVKDHDHMTGLFRGAAHSACNLQYKLRYRIPVVFHNLRGYDAHLIMQAIGKVKSKNLKCIPNNMEKYVSFSMGNMDFIDSFQFLSASLEQLVENLSKEGHSKFIHLRDYVQRTSPGSLEEKQKLLMRKGVYPYNYMDCFEKFDESELPPASAFYNWMTDSQISQEDYQHAQLFWNTFRIQDMGQYHDLYMESDTLLLADVFENFRKLCLNTYELDPLNFYTAPGLAWQACLKMTKVRLELLTDIDMHLFVEKGLRGGIAMVANRYGKANNSYVPGYDSSKESEYLIYLDANNLYGWSMSQALPTHGFEWLTAEELDALDVQTIADDAEEGYILEVNLDYPAELHDDHNCLPLAPEPLEIKPSMLSPYQKKLRKDLGIKGRSARKLVPNLNSKTEYVLHYRNLKQYTALGMKVTKVHRALKFTQKAWLKEYVDFNTERRKKAKNDFEKDFYKLMNNSVFGKTMENLRKRVDVQLVHREKRLTKLTAKPGFHAFKIFNPDLAAVELKKQNIYLNRPIYTGFSILDLSKTLMYDFHYNYIKKKYGSNATLLFTDTYSLSYKIKTKDLYEDMEKDSDYFDFSEYPSGHFLYNAKNKKVVGKMKDETKSVPITEFIGLKAKMYSLTYGNKQKQTAKGISKHAIKSQLRHDLYKNCVEQQEIYMTSMTQFRSEKHQIYSIQLNKIGLSPYDDKRYLLNDGITSLSFGHWRISKVNST